MQTMQPQDRRMCFDIVRGALEQTEVEPLRNAELRALRMIEAELNACALPYAVKSGDGVPAEEKADWIAKVTERLDPNESAAVAFRLLCHHLTECERDSIAWQRRLAEANARECRLAAENARLREALKRHKDYQDMKQRWAEESLSASPTRSTPRPPIVKPPHGD